MITFLIITAIVIGIIVLMNNIKTKPKAKPKSVMDVLSETPKFIEVKRLFEMMQTMNEGGTDQDVMPYGYGEFGHEATNPIPVNTVIGSIAYLGTLRTLDGSKVQYERMGAVRVPNINKMIDKYKIVANGKLIAYLFISPYNKKNSDRAPKGFKILPLP